MSPGAVPPISMPASPNSSRTIDSASDDRVIVACIAGRNRPSSLCIDETGGGGGGAGRSGEGGWWSMGAFVRREGARYKENSQDRPGRGPSRTSAGGRA